MRKLDIGTQGKKIDASWETLSIDPNDRPDIIADIRKKLPIPDNTYDLIYMSHVLEHIPWYETVNVLKELYRVMKPSRDYGIEIYVPDIDKLIDAYQKGIIPDQWYKYNEKKDPFLWFVGRLYTYGNSCFEFHKSAFNYEHLRKCLEEAGFRGVHRIHNPRGNDHGYINLGVGAYK